MFQTGRQLESDSPVTEFTSNIVLALIVLALIGIPIAIMHMLGAGQVDPNAERYLINNGYTDVTITGARWSGCNRGDLSITEFEAKSPITQANVTGVVCTNMYGQHSVKEN